ncbi:hypothetical protein P5E93_14840 [Clostridium perfringens]|nr:hypothetical protein [Clostridium perfringens]
MKNVFKKAHEITKNIIRKGDSYRETFRLALIFVYSQIKKGENKMVELKGTEKQVKWANDIRKELLSIVEETRNHQVERVSKKEDKVKKDGTVLTAQDRVNKMNARFNNIVEVIESNNESVWFIENFKSLTSDRFDILKRGSVERAFEEIEELGKYAKYFQYR